MGQPSIDCAIRDLTPEGARLVFANAAPTSLPDRFLVFMPGVDELWAARLRWRKRGEIGVEFIVGEADWSSAPRYPDLFALRIQVAELMRAANSNVENARPDFEERAM
ncbi:MAG TPA: hypothetical protein VGG12_01805 [Methylovirgula sp.]